MQCVEVELEQGGVETIDPEIVPVVFSEVAAEDEQLRERLGRGDVQNAAGTLRTRLLMDSVMSAEFSASVVAGDGKTRVLIDGSDDEGDEYFDDDDEDYDDDFDDLDDLDDDYEDEEEGEEEFDPDIEDLG